MSASESQAKKNVEYHVDGYRKPCHHDAPSIQVMNTHWTHLNSTALIQRRGESVCAKLGYGFMPAAKAHDWSLPTKRHDEQGALTPH